MKKQKKGQITIFILLGLVFVISISALVYIQKQGLVFRHGNLISGEAEPIVDYVDMCIDELGKEALMLAGHQGGFVKLPDYIQNNPFTHLDYGLKIPYWYYEGRDISPSLDEIELQLADYVNENLDECINNLEQFQQEFDIEFDEQHSVQVDIARKDVNFKLTYPIILTDKLKQKVIFVSEYNSKIDVAFKKVYELAKRILEKENSDMYFEQITVDLMGMNEGIPFTGMQIKCTGGPMQWLVADINLDIREALAKDISRIRVKGTDYVPFMENEGVYKDLEEYDLEDIMDGNLPENVPLDAYDYFHYFWDINYRSDLKVGFNYYPEYGLMLKVRPSNSGIMKSNVAKGTSYLNFLCIHSYHFSYDVNYPVEVIVRDDDSLKGEGYVFRYAIPIMIDHNIPNREKITQSIFTYYGSEEDYSLECEDEEGMYNIIANGFDEYMYQSELDGVDITYDCLRFECELGETEFQGSFTGLMSGLTEGCSHGFIKAEKEGYLEVVNQVTSEQIDRGIIEFWMPKLKEFPYEIMSHKYSPATETFGNEELFEGTATVRLMHNSYDFDKIDLYNTDNDTIEVLVDLPQTYSLEIMLLEDEEIIGGWNGNWTVSYEDLKDKNKLVFHTFEYWPKPITDDEMMDMYTYLFEGDYQSLINHEFIFVNETVSEGEANE